jgi:hypothetical protein
MLSEPLLLQCHVTTVVHHSWKFSPDPNPPSYPSPPHLTYLGHTFYPLDFVYLIPKGNSHLYDIGQILSIPNSEEIQVLKYRRLDKPQGPFSEVCMILVRSTNILLNELLKAILVPTAKV